VSKRDLIDRASAVKSELDRLEFAEPVAALQREAAVADYDIDGSFVLRLPHHPAVAAYAHELASVKRARDVTDLALARSKLKTAHDDYRARVGFRLRHDIHADGDDYVAFRQFVSLTAILEARAEAMFWRGIVAGLENREQTNKRNRWAMGFRPRRVLTRFTDDGLAETGRHSRGADPLPIVRRVGHGR
jgi:hypothetical protein